MKFLCPNCKAKYRIGPEKMVGRQAAKIRCRKCEYLIQIAYRGNSDEFDVTATPPTVPPAAAPAPPAARPPKVTAGQPAVPPAPALGARPRLAPPVKEEGSANKKPTAAVPGLPGLGSAKSTRGAALLSDASALQRRPLAPLPPPPVPPLSTLGSSAVSPPTGSAYSSATGTVAAVAIPAPAPVNLPSPPPARSSTPTSTQLGDQFRESVQAGSVEDLPQEGWFVGVNGVPLGPIPLVDLRELANAGHIDRRSLVWREGQGEWRPLGKFPGLVRVIDDGAGVAVAPPPAAPEAPAAPPPPSSRTNGLNGQHVVTGFDAVRPDTGERPSVWGDLDDEDDEDEQPTTVKGRVSVFPGPDSLPPPSSTSLPPPSSTSLPAPPQRSLPAPPPSQQRNGMTGSFGVTGSAGMSGSTGTSSVSAVSTLVSATPLSAPPVARDGGVPSSSISATPEPLVEVDAPMKRPGRSRWYLLAAAVVFAFALGAVVMYLVFSPGSDKPDSDKPGKDTTSSIRSGADGEASTKGSEASREAAKARAERESDEDDEATPAAQASASGSRAPAKALPAPAVAAGPRPSAPIGASSAVSAGVSPGVGASTPPSASAAGAASAPAAASKPAAAGSLLAGIGSPQTPGPGLAPRSDSTAGATSLDATAIQRTVRRYSPTVRQNCWQRALNARAPGTPSSAKVNARITIDASGHVQAVTVDGAPKGYPGLSRCIEGAVKGWTFPRAGGQTVTSVPFMFVGQ